MKNKKGVISFDLDLTLLEHDTMRITTSSLQAIERLREDYYIVLASGRDMDLPNICRFRDQINPDAIIHANGARVTIGEQIVRNCYIPGELLKEIIEVSKANHWCVGAYLGDYAYFANVEKAIEMYTEWWGKCDREFRPMEELLYKKLYTMMICDTFEIMCEFERKFPQLHLMHFAGMRGADIIMKDISKCTGMEVLLEKWGKTFTDVIAFGDSHNDMELLQAAGVGVAMGNSEEYVKKIADIVTDDIHEDGIWNACKKMNII